MGKQQEYLAKAKEAEALGAKAGDGYMRENWLSIAEGYRDLAKANMITLPGEAAIDTGILAAPPAPKEGL